MRYERCTDYGRQFNSASNRLWGAKITSASENVCVHKGEASATPITRRLGLLAYLVLLGSVMRGGLRAIRISWRRTSAPKAQPAPSTLDMAPPDERPVRLIAMTGRRVKARLPLGGLLYEFELEAA